MYLPDRRWYAGALGLALVALAAIPWPAAAGLLAVLDLLWLVLLVSDGWRLAGLDPERLGPRRESPPAFSVGRPLPVTYHWTNPLDRPLDLLVREELPSPLRAERPERRLRLPAADGYREQLLITPCGVAEAWEAGFTSGSGAPWGSAGGRSGWSGRGR